MSQPDTKDRILDAAERLFATHGFEATSLRAITTEAGVNLAAVNYHFQSKDALVHAVFERAIGPVNARRLEILSEMERAAGDRPVTPEQILEAFFRPVVDRCGTSRHIPRIMVRMQYVEGDELVEEIYERHFRHLLSRFIGAMKRALPDLSEEDLFWRMQFVVGSFAHLMAQGNFTRVMAKARKKFDPQAALDRLIAFAAAGLRSR